MNFIGFGLEYYKKSEASYIKTSLNIRGEIKQGTLRIGFSPKVQKEIMTIDNSFSDPVTVSEKDLFSKKEYVKIYSIFQELDKDKNDVKIKLKIKKEDLILFSSVNFVQVDNNQLPSYVPLIVMLKGQGAEKLNKKYDLVIVKVEDNKQKIYTLDGKEWTGNFSMIRSYKSVR